MHLWCLQSKIEDLWSKPFFERLLFLSLKLTDTMSKDESKEPLIARDSALIDKIACEEFDNDCRKCWTLIFHILTCGIFKLLSKLRIRDKLCCCSGRCCDIFCGSLAWIFLISVASFIISAYFYGVFIYMRYWNLYECTLKESDNMTSWVMNHFINKTQSNYSMWSCIGGCRTVNNDYKCVLDGKITSWWISTSCDMFKIISFLALGVSITWYIKISVNNYYKRRVINDPILLKKRI